MKHTTVALDRLLPAQFRAPRFAGPPARSSIPIRPRRSRSTVPWRSGLADERPSGWSDAAWRSGSAGTKAVASL